MKKNILLKLFSVFLFLTVSNNYLFGQEIIYQQNFDGNNGTFSGNHEFINTTGVNGIYANTVGAQTGNPYYYRHLWSVSSLGSGNFAPISGKSLGLGIYQDLSMFYANTPFRTYNGTNCAVLPVTTRWAYIPISTVGYENIQVEFKWRATGEVSGSTVYDYGTFFTSINGGANWLIDTNGGQAGNTSIDGNLSGGVYYNNPNVSTQILDLPSSRNNQPQFAIGFRMVVDECYGTGGAFIIDDIIVRGTPISTDRTLTVSEAYTGGTPANGSHTYTDGASVTATAGTRPGYNLLGWTGTGSVSPTGTTNSIAFNITQNSSIEWLWEAIQPEFHNYGGEEQLAFNNSKINTENPVFRLSHKGGTANGYQIQISSAPDFSSGTVSQTFTGTFAAEEENNFTFTNGSFTSGTTYYVRAAVDMGGGYLTDGWTTETYSFTYQSDQETPSWFQTTQAQFESDELAGVTANASHNVVTNPGGNLVVNGDFLNSATSWNVYRSYSSMQTATVVNAGDSDCPVCTPSPSKYFKMGYSWGSTNILTSDRIVLGQAVDFTDVSELKFDLSRFRSFGGIGSPTNLKLEVRIGGGANDEVGTIVHTANLNSNSSTYDGTITINTISYSGTQNIKFIVKTLGTWDSNTTAYFYVSNVIANAPPTGTITSTPIHLASVQNATAYEGLRWKQTLNGGEMTLKVQHSTDGETAWTDVAGYNDISFTAHGEQYLDLTGMQAYPHIRLLAELDGDGVTLHDWEVEFEREILDCELTTTWDGDGWSNGAPTESPLMKVIFEDDFDIDSEDLYACSVEVKTGFEVVVSSGYNLIVENEVVVKDKGDLLLKDGANLVQINDDAVNSGNITAEKGFTFSTERNQYNFVISPVKDQNIKELFAENDYKAQWYNEATNYFIFFEGEYDELGGAGIGQAIQENQNGDAVQTAIYEGEPHNGIIKVDSLSDDYSRYHLAGNPYPSQLDLVKFYEDNNENIESTFLFWDNRGNIHINQQGDNYGGSNYASFNIEAGNGTGTAALGATDSLRVPTRNVAVGNGFMLQLKTGGNSYTFNNAQRTAGQGQNFLGRNYSTDGISSEIDRYWLTLNTPGGISAMNAVVYFDGGNDDFGKDDSKITGGSDDIYSIVEEHKLKIQGKSSFEISDTIALGYKAFHAGPHSINLYQSEGVFTEGVNILLIDKALEITQNLSAEGSYSFTTEAGEFQERFIIVYEEQGTEEPEEPEEPDEPLANVEIEKGGLIVYKHGSQTVISSEKLDLLQLEVFNLQGQKLMSQDKIHAEAYRLDNERLGKQALLLVVTTADGKEHSFKILTQ